MNRKLLFAAAACCIATIIGFSCKKKADDTSTITTSKSALFSGLKSDAQVFNVTAGVPGKVVGKNGTVIHFYPNSFRDKNSVTITSGTINIELVEMYKPGTMIANGATTSTSTALLASGGQVKIKAWKNGQEVFANTYRIAFKQPNTSNQQMELFYGNTNNSDSIATWTAFGDSTKPGTTAKSTIAVTDTTADTTGGSGGGSTYTYPPGIYYIFDSCTDFNWVNVDRFYSSPTPLTKEITVTLPDNSFTQFNTNIFIMLPTENAVTQFEAEDALTYKPRIKLPTGSSYKLVVITNKGGTYYYCEKTGTITAGESISPSMAEETLYDIKARLGAL
jgi:hypothetical protein